MSARRNHHGHEQESGLRSHHKLLVAVAAALALGWLAWNVLLVESDVATVAEGQPAVGPQAR